MHHTKSDLIGVKSEGIFDDQSTAILLTKVLPGSRIQSWDAYNLSLYAGVRQYEIKVPGRAVEPILVIPVGVLFSF